MPVLDPEALQLLSIIFFVVQIIGGVALALMAGCAACVFLQALWVKHRPLRPLESPSHPASRGVRSLVALASEAGFQSVGFLSEADKGSDKGHVYTLMLSSDACILFHVRHDRLSPPYRFMTPLADGHWVITSVMTDEMDLSGLDDEQMLPRGFNTMLSRHRARIAASSSALPVFSPDSITQHLHEHEQACLNRLVAAKLAKFVPGQEAQWRYTLRGAGRQTRACLRRLREYQKMLADQRKRPEKLRLEK